MCDSTTGDEKKVDRRCGWQLPNRKSLFQPERCEYPPCSVEDKRLTYVTELLDCPLGCACHSRIYTVCDNPGDVQEPTNGLSKVAHEK